MFKSLILASAIAAAVQAAPVHLSPQAKALIAPVHEAIEKLRAEQATLPPPKDDREKLARMRSLDQASREAMSQIDFSKLPLDQRKAAGAAMWREVNAIDEANQKALLAMLPPEGWFTIGKYGKDGSTTAFLIIQHSDLSQWKRFVPLLEKLAAKGEVAKDQYALMYDRLALFEHRPQRYGTQLSCKGGKWTVDASEDPDHLDQRRAAMGLPPEKDYLELFAKNPAC